MCLKFMIFTYTQNKIVYLMCSIIVYFFSKLIILNNNKYSIILNIIKENLYFGTN